MEDPQPSIFHTGSLQDGIAVAIRTRKLVACFIHTPGEHVSQIWEDYWLVNKPQPTDMISSDVPSLGLMLAEKAVLLKIEFGSQEAQFLSAFVKVEKAPCMVVIHNGKVLEQIGAEVGKEEFEGRLLRAVGFEGAENNESLPEKPSEELNEDDETMIDDVGSSQVASEAQGPESEGASTIADQRTAASTQVQTMLAERARRLEIEKARKEAAEKAERIARATARREEEERASAQPKAKGKGRAISPSKEQQQARDQWIYQQKQRKDEAKKERERILAQIENDKLERRAQAQRKKEAGTIAGGGAVSAMPSSSADTVSRPKAAISHDSCSLQVRLFDGSSIRAKFAADADIATAVRTWVKEASPEGGADIPFTFRQILVPNPSKTIEVAEEHHSLLELGLVPSATLVLVPAAGATSAYASNSSGYVGTAYSAASWAANSVSGLLGTLWSFIPGVGGSEGPYIGGVGDEQERSNIEGARMAGSDSAAPGEASIRVRGLRQGGDDRVAEFYNGNSSAFEGRKGEDEAPERGSEV